jgi:glycosyltransferase involved in cell wall biosynthesis
MPKVAVIIPTYNRAEFLHSAITSVLRQTFQDLEIIVVDDASEDNTLNVVNGFGDKRIRSVHHEIRKGEAAARNSGIMNSNAEYIAFLDDDDEWLPEKLQLQVDLLEKSPPEVGVVYAGFTTIDRKTGRILGEGIPSKRGDIYKDMVVGNVVGTPSTVLLRRQCFEQVGSFDKKIAYNIDYDMWIRISKEFWFECIEKPLVRYYVHERQVSNNLGDRIRGQETLLEKYEQFFALDKEAYGEQYAHLGSLCWENENVRKAARAFLKAAIAYPWKLEYYSYLIRCLGFILLGKRNFVRVKRLKDRCVVRPKNQ